MRRARPALVPTRGGSRSRRAAAAGRFAACQKAPRSTARCKPRPGYSSRPSWMRSAASTSPAASASKIRLNGAMGISTPTACGAIRRSTSQAVVVTPGMPTRRPFSCAADQRPGRHHHRSVTAAHRRPVRQDLITIGDRRIDAERDGHDIGRPVQRQPVERRRIGAPVREREAGGIDGADPDRVEHERVVRVDRIGQRDVRHHAHLSRASPKGPTLTSVAS